jgi:hypothetical protein
LYFGKKSLIDPCKYAGFKLIVDVGPEYFFLKISLKLISLLSASYFVKKVLKSLKILLFSYFLVGDYVNSIVFGLLVNDILLTRALKSTVKLFYITLCFFLSVLNYLIYSLILFP